MLRSIYASKGEGGIPGKLEHTCTLPTYARLFSKGNQATSSWPWPLPADLSGNCDLSLVKGLPGFCLC